MSWLDDNEINRKKQELELQQQKAEYEKQFPEIEWQKIIQEYAPLVVNLFNDVGNKYLQKPRKILFFDVGVSQDWKIETQATTQSIDDGYGSYSRVEIYSIGLYGTDRFNLRTIVGGHWGDFSHRSQFLRLIFLKGQHHSTEQHFPHSYSLKGFGTTMTEYPDWGHTVILGGGGVPRDKQKFISEVQLLIKQELANGEPLPLKEENGK